MSKRCTECKHCTYARGFMATCYVTYEETRDGKQWLVSEGKDINFKKAEKCPHYERKDKRD